MKRQPNSCQTLSLPNNPEKIYNYSYEVYEFVWHLNYVFDCHISVSKKMLFSNLVHFEALDSCCLLADGEKKKRFCLAIFNLIYYYS